MDANSQTNSVVGRVNALTQEQRDAAYQSARLKVAGGEPVATERPVPADFERITFSRYSESHIKTMRGFGYIVLTAAFIPSAIRIFIAAFLTAIAITPDSPLLAVVVGGTSILLAEAGQIAFTLWAATTEEKGLRIALWFGSVGCLMFALVGNAQTVEPWRQGVLFAWLETFVPPFLVLIASHVLKTQTLHEMENRHEAQQAYAEASVAWETEYRARASAWKIALEGAHVAPDWEVSLVNALWEAIRNANRQSKAVLRELTNQDKRWLVMRERRAEEWWLDATLEAERLEHERAETLRLETEQREAQRRQQERLDASRNALLPSGKTSTKATGEISTWETFEADGMIVKVCPDCGSQVRGATPRAATNAAVAHKKKHANERKRSDAEEIAFSTNGHSVTEVEG